VFGLLCRDVIEATTPKKTGRELVISYLKQFREFSLFFWDVWPDDTV